MNLFENLRTGNWKTILDYEEYMISNKGEVIKINKFNICILKNSNTKTVILSKNKKTKSFSISKLVNKLFDYEEIDESFKNRVENLEGEIWKDIVGYEGTYQISNMGRVKTLYGRNEKLRTLKLNRSGYLEVNLWKGSSEKQNYPTVHRLVAQAFIPNPENKPHVNHINCIRNDNRVKNLEWCTPHENMQHAAKMGRTYKIWENNVLQVNSKLDENKVREVRRLYYEEKMAQEDIAKKFGVSKGAISAVIVWRTWFYVDPELKNKYLSIKSTKHKKQNG